MPEVDEGFSPLPEFAEPLDPLDELTLDDALAEEDERQRVDVAEPPAPLGRAPAFDFGAQRFIPSVSGGPLMTRGRATLQTWVEKCLRTKRGEAPAVHPDFGCDMTVEDLLEEGEPFDAAAVTEYTDAVRRALLVHPRITDVEGLSVEGSLDDEAVFVSLTVITDDEDLGELVIDSLRIGG